MISIDEKHVEKAEELKKEGNLRYAEGRLEEAIELYTEGISNNPQNHVLYANRSIANFKLEYYKLALEDANKSIELNKLYSKAYYRKASAHMALGQLKG
jgi:serine/threonine-protein phosphatase 5